MITEMICPNDRTRMETIEETKTFPFRGKELTVRAETFKCSECGYEEATTEQAARNQVKLADKYRKGEGLLTSYQIRECRSKLGLTQAELAEKVGVGIASIRRWENGVVQSRSMDQLLRFSFENIR